jgi:hypothetical protein
MFDVLQGTNVYEQSVSRVTLSGNGMDLVREVPRQSGAGWMTYRLVVHELAGWRKGYQGQPASHAEILQVLGSLTNLTIEGYMPPDTGQVQLDNIGLWAAQSRQVASLQLASGITATNRQMIVQWPDVPVGYELESIANLSSPSPTNWTRLQGVYDPLTGIFTLTLPFTNQQQYLRLKRP